MQHSEKAQFYKPAGTQQDAWGDISQASLSLGSNLRQSSHNHSHMAYMTDVHQGGQAHRHASHCWDFDDLQHPCTLAHMHILHLLGLCNRIKKCSFFKLFLIIYLVLTLKQIYIGVELLNIYSDGENIFFLTTTLTQRWNRAFSSFLFLRFLFVALALYIWS